MLCTGTIKTSCFLNLHFEHEKWIEWKFAYTAETLFFLLLLDFELFNVTICFVLCSCTVFSYSYMYRQSS